MKIELKEPYGYCYGVKHALKIVLDLREKNPSSKIFLSRPLIHNEYTNNKLTNENDICVLKEDENNLEDAFLVFSAHGLTSKDLEYAKLKKARSIDTTCPFLLKAKKDIINDLNENKKVVFIGKNNHPETTFILDIDKRIKYVSLEDLRKNKLVEFKNNLDTVIYPQSTISLDDFNLVKDILKDEDFKDIMLHSICYECLSRWSKALEIEAKTNDAFIVVGSYTSSNSVEFYNLLKSHYKNDVFLLTNEEDALKVKEEINKKDTVYLFSATSAPSELVLKIKEVLEN